MSTSTPTTPPKSSLAKLVIYQKPKTFKVMVLGQAAIGKSALVVRFITRRFIGDYDPNLEDIYAFQTIMDNETVNFQILDSAGELRENEYSKLEANIRWADAFILMYSVTDKCSFDECHRLKFLINYNKRRCWRLTSHMRFGDDNSMPRGLGGSRGMPVVVLVGNKSDLTRDRMLSTRDGNRLCKEIGAVCFHEISVRESIEQCWEVFHDARRFWRVSNKWGGLRSELGCMENPARPLDRAASTSEPEPTAAVATVAAIDLYEEDEWADPDEEERSAAASSPPVDEHVEGFRARSCTESKLPARVARPRDPRPPLVPRPLARRTSVAMKGDNDSSF